MCESVKNSFIVFTFRITHTHCRESIVITIKLNNENNDMFLHFEVIWIHFCNMSNDSICMCILECVWAYIRITSRFQNRKAVLCAFFFSAISIYVCEREITREWLCNRQLSQNQIHFQRYWSKVWGSKYFLNYISTNLWRLLMDIFSYIINWIIFNAHSHLILM